MSQGIRNNQVKAVNKITQDEHEDNLDAKRVTLVNEGGESGVGTSPANPIFVQLSDGSVNIGTVNAELEVQLSHRDDDPDSGDVHDSVRIGDGEFEVNMTPSEDESRIGMNTMELAKLFTKPLDRIRRTAKNDDGDITQVISSFKGVDVQQLDIVYDLDGDFDDAYITDL